MAKPELEVEIKTITTIIPDNTFRIKVKKLHPKAVIPTRAKYGDAGMDLTAVSVELDEEGNIVYGTGLAFEIPYGYCMLLFPRSSNKRTSLVLTNHVGIVDPGYRGEIFFKYAQYKRDPETSLTHPIYKEGERIGQLMIIPIFQCEFVESEKLSDSERGTGGYGSTGL